MSLTVNDKIVYPSRCETADVLIGVRRVRGSVPGHVERFVSELEAACFEGGIDLAFAAAHAANECDYWRDTDWTEHFNAFGIGHPDNADGGIEFASPRACARFAVGEYLLKLRRPIPPSLADARSYAPSKWDQVKAIVGGSLGIFPTVERISDLGKHFGPNNREAVWFTDATGAQSIVAKGNALVNVPDQQAGGTQPMQYTTTIPGLPGGPLVTDYKIIVDILPASMTLNRPGTKARSPRRCVQHGNGNPSSSARGERNFLHAGAPGNNGQPQQTSYHATADDTVIYVLIPLDEVTWQAADGSGPGNMNGYSCEMVEDNALWANVGRRDRLVHICSDFMGRVAARLHVAKPEQHWDFNFASSNRHDCPNKLRHQTIGGLPAWQVYEGLWHAAKTLELDAMSGGQPEPEPIPEPVPKPLKLPPGMSTGVVRKLFNPFDLRRPGGGKVSFNIKGEVSGAWLRNALSTIPDGAAWTEGEWDGLDAVIQRGDGRIVFSFGNFTVEQAAA